MANHMWISIPLLIFVKFPGVKHSSNLFHIDLLTIYKTMKLQFYFLPAVTLTKQFIIFHFLFRFQSFSKRTSGKKIIVGVQPEARDITITFSFKLLQLLPLDWNVWIWVALGIQNILTVTGTKLERGYK